MHKDLIYNDSSDILVEVIAREWPVVFINTTNREVYEKFSEDQEIISIPVLDWSKRPVGIISRASFLGNVAKPFFREIYFEKKCTTFMGSSPVIVETRTPIQDCAVVASDASQKAISEGIILTRQGIYQGMGVVQDILRLMAEIHLENSKRIQLQRDTLEEVVLERTKALVAAKEDAEQASRAKGLFLSNMSHEIRTPITAIIGMAQIMLREGVDGEQGVRLEKINTASSHLLGIVNDILDFSKINAGELELSNEPIDIDLLLKEVVSITDDLAKSKDLTLNYFHRLPSSVVLGDSIRLRQAILNYVSNAIKFTSSGTVTIGCRQFEDSPNSISLEFEVVDTGPGIRSDVLSTLFSPFQQGDLSSTKKFGGTGLGLVITKQLAKLMGGDAGADSTLGAGSRFWFTAKFNKPVGSLASIKAVTGNSISLRSADLAGITSSVMHPLQEWKVLVVDDEPINREVIEYFLNDWGLEFDSAQNGLEALKALEHKNYDIVIMDVQMPVLDGLAATRKIRERWRQKNIYIIALSANAYGEDREKCFDAGVDEFVAKPFFPEELRTVLFENYGNRKLKADSKHGSVHYMFSGSVC